MSQEPSPELTERFEGAPLLPASIDNNDRTYGSVSHLDSKYGPDVEGSAVSDARESSSTSTTRNEGAEYAASRHLIVLVLTFGKQI